MDERSGLAVAGGDVMAFHDASAAAFFGGGVFSARRDDDLWSALSDNHDNNMRLWAEEDLARRLQVPDAAIAANKRAIDRFNQARNDAIERMDEIFAAALLASPAGTARLNSETPGAIIDRLSIASLKIYHMGLQARRKDADRAHRATCAARDRRLRDQRGDLGRCLDELLADCGAGRARFAIYRQFKMYNDPALNMALVRERRGGGDMAQEPAAS